MSNIREAKHTYNQLVAVLCDFVGSLNSFRIGLDVFWAVTFIAAPTEACSLRGDGAVDHVRSPPSTARKVLDETAPSARRVRAGRPLRPLQLSKINPSCPIWGFDFRSDYRPNAGFTNLSMFDC
jgi:hypothetical protein